MKKDDPETDSDHPLHHILSDRTQPGDLPSYLVLLQHTIHLPHRITCAIPPSDAHVYESAGLLNPSVSARNDIGGGSLWMREINDFLTLQNTDAILLQCVGNTDWGEREGAISVDLWTDPLGWDDGDDEREKPGVIRARLDDLQGILEAIERAEDRLRTDPNRRRETDTETEKAPAVLIFDSVDPLLAFHGVESTLNFLDRLRRRRTRRFSSIVVPILTESSRPRDHRRLEDASDSVLTVSEGHLRVVRKSRRGCGKMITEVRRFAVVGTGSRSTLHIPDGEGAGDGSRPEAEDAALTGLTFKLGRLSSQEEEARSNTVLPFKKKIPSKIKLLRHDEGGRIDEEKVADKGPRIFLQDDDPEFDDMDEEDPDDDLDI